MHAECVNRHVRCDLARSKNHEKAHEVGSIDEPKSALPLFDIAAMFAPKYVELV